MPKERILNELKSELAKLVTKLGVTVLKEFSSSLDGFADKIALPAETSEKEQ